MPRFTPQQAHQAVTAIDYTLAPRSYLNSTDHEMCASTAYILFKTGDLSKTRELYDDAIRHSWRHLSDYSGVQRETAGSHMAKAIGESPDYATGLSYGFEGGCGIQRDSEDFMEGAVDGAAIRETIMMTESST